MQNGREGSGWKEYEEPCLEHVYDYQFQHVHVGIEQYEIYLQPVLILGSEGTAPCCSLQPGAKSGNIRV